jgi:phosphatidylglycerophosphate synthase
MVVVFVEGTLILVTFLVGNIRGCNISGQQHSWMQHFWWGTLMTATYLVGTLVVVTFLVGNTRGCNISGGGHSWVQHFWSATLIVVTLIVMTTYYSNEYYLHHIDGISCVESLFGGRIYGGRKFPHPGGRGAESVVRCYISLLLLLSKRFDHI